MRNVAVILAGGKGNRFGGELPKQLVLLSGKTIIEHSIDAFQTSSFIDEIYIVSNPDYIKEITVIASKPDYFKVTKILKGGSERSDSSLSAINACTEECNLIFHDAVRPMVSQRIITDVVEAMNIHPAVAVAIPSSDTILKVDTDSLISDIPDRRELMCAQTPQGLKLSCIKEAYKLALNDVHFKATDDCGVVRKYLPTQDIYVVKGEETNIKITYEFDLLVAEQILKIKNT